MLRVLAKDIRDALESALALHGFDDEIEATVQLLLGFVDGRAIVLAGVGISEVGL